MSNKIQSNKKIRMCLDFIFLKQGFIFFSFFFNSEDTSIFIIEKNKTKQRIKQADKKIKMCLDFIFLKQGFIFFFYSEDTSVLIIKKIKQNKTKQNKE